jgi:dephospho-CoA kinase
MEQTMTPSILGLCGGIGSGKDTACEIAEEFDFQKVGFADHLKATCQFLTGHDYTLRETKDSEVLPGVTGRKLLETIGQTMRNLDENFWVNKLFEKHPENIAICDVRYENEVRAIKEKGIVTKIIREGCQRTGHESDNWEALKSDFCIINDGTLEEFKQEVRNLIAFVCTAV